MSEDEERKTHNHPEGHKQPEANKTIGIKHLVNAVRFSCQGLSAAFRREAAFRHELGVIVLTIPAGLWIAQSVLEFAALLVVCILVLIMELFNSAIEAIMDRMGDESHTLAGLAKDYGSAAVMLSMLIALVVWGTLLFHRLQ